MAKKEYLNDRAMKMYTDMLIEQLEQMERSNWQKPWVSSNFKQGPQNINGRPYRGMNTLLLALLSINKKYELPVFMTVNQAKEAGITVNKGSKGFPVSFWKRFVRDKDGNELTEDAYDRLPEEEKKHCRVFGYNRYYFVFNTDQTNIREAKPELWEKLKDRMMNRVELTDENRMFKSPELDWILKNQKWICPIHTIEGDHAFYSLGKDNIVVPLKGQFANGEDFYTTMLHEMIHSTGTEERLNRKNFSSSKNEDYAREELVAELGAALSAIDLGINKTIKDESKQYLKGWLDNMRQSPKFLESVIADTNRAVNMLHDNVMTQEMQEGIKNETLESIGAFIDEKKAEEENRKPTVKPGEITTSIRPKTEESQRDEERKTDERTYYIPSRTIHDSQEMKPLMELHDAGLSGVMGDRAIGTETAEWISLFIEAEPQMDLSRRDAEVLRETDTNAAVLYNESGGPRIDVYHKVDEAFLRSKLREWDVLNVIVANGTVTDLAVRMAGEEVAAHPEIPRTVEVAEGENLQWRFNGESGHIEMGLDTDHGFETFYSRGVDLTRPLEVTVEDLRGIAADDARIRLANTDYLKDLADDLNKGWVHFDEVAQKMERDGVVPYEMSPRQAQVLLYSYLSDELRRQDPTYDGSKEYEQWKADKDRLRANSDKLNILVGYSLQNGNRWALDNGDQVQWKYNPYEDRIRIGHDNGYFFVKEMEFQVDNTKDIIRNLEDVRSEVLQHYSRGNSLLPDLAEGINSGRLTFVEAGDILQRTGHYPWHPSIEETKAYLHDMLRPELQGNVALDELAKRNSEWNRMEKDGFSYTFNFNDLNEGWVHVRGNKDDKPILNESMPVGVLIPQGERSGLEDLKEEAYILAEWQAALRGNDQYPQYNREWNVKHHREIVLPDFTVVGFERGVDDKGKDALFMGPVDAKGNVLPHLVRPMDEFGFAATPAGQLADKALLREFAIAHAEELKLTNDTGQTLSDTVGEKVREDVPMLRDYTRFKEKYPETLLLFGNQNKDQYTVFQQDAETVSSRQGLTAVQGTDLADREGKPLQVLQFTGSELDRIVSDSVRNGNRVAILDLDPEIEQMVKEFVAANRVQNAEGQEVKETPEQVQAEPTDETMYYTSVAYLQFDTDTARFDELKEAGKWDELLAEAAEYDQGNAIDLEETHLSPSRHNGDNLLDENGHYAVVYNNSVGGTYDILRKVPENEVWESIQRNGGVNGGWCTSDVKELAVKMMEKGYDAIKDRPQVIELSNGETRDWTLKESSTRDFYIQVGQMDENGLNVEREIYYDLEKTFSENLATVKEELEEGLGQQQTEGQTASETVAAGETVQQPEPTQTAQQTDDPEIEFRQGRNLVEVFVNQAQLGTITYDREWKPVQGADEALLQHPKVAEAVEDMRTRGNMMESSEGWSTVLVALKPLNPPTLIYDNPRNYRTDRIPLSVEEINGQQVGVVERDKRELVDIPGKEEVPRAHVGLPAERLQEVLAGKDPLFQPFTPEKSTEIEQRADRYLRAYEFRYHRALLSGDPEMITHTESRLKAALNYKFQGMDNVDLYKMTGSTVNRVKEMAKQDRWLMGVGPTMHGNHFEVFVKQQGSRTFQPYNVTVDLPMTKKEAQQHAPDFWHRSELPYLATYMDSRMQEKGFEAYQLRDTQGKTLYDSRKNEGRVARLSAEWREDIAIPQRIDFESIGAGAGVSVQVRNEDRSAQVVIHPDRKIEHLGHYPLTAENRQQIEEFARRGNMLRPDITDRKVLMLQPVNEPTKIYDNVYKLRQTPVSVEEVNGVRLAVTRQGEVLAEGEQVDLLPDNTRENFLAINEKADRYLKGYAERITAAVRAGDDEGVRKQSENFIRILKYQQQDAFDHEEAEDLIQEIIQGAMSREADRTASLVRDIPEGNGRDRINVFQMRDGVHMGICVVHDGERSATRRLTDEEARTYREMMPGEARDEFKRQLADKYVYSQTQVRPLPSVAPDIRGRITEAALLPRSGDRPYMVRAKIDGVQQMAKPVGMEHVEAYFHNLKGQPREVVEERRAQLAAVYFHEELQSVDRNLEKGLRR